MIEINRVVKKSALVAAILLVALACGSAAWAGTVESCAAAAPVTPTNTVFPTDCTGSTSGILLASLSSPFSYTTTAGTNTGTIYSAVYNDGGTLDFYYQVSNDATSNTALSRLTGTNFAGFTTDVAYLTNGASLGGFVNGSDAPVTADSNATGSVIGFNFNPPVSSEIAPGTQSDVLIISTNATSFTAGNASIIDGGTDTVASFQPGVATPEPASLGLLGLGLLGLAGMRRRLRG